MTVSTNSPDRYELPVLPLKNSVLYPNLVMPLSVGRKASLAAVEAALAKEDQFLAVVSQLDGSVEEPRLSDLFGVGTRAVIKKVARTEGGMQLVVQGLERIEIRDIGHAQPYLRVEATILPQPSDWSPEGEALEQAIMETGAKMLERVNPEARPGVSRMVGEVKDPLNRVYLIASMLTLDLEKEHRLLATNSQIEALRLMHEYLSHELQVLELRQKIQSQAASEMSREQREYLLRQQLRAIQQELGEKSPEQADIEELRERLVALQISDHVRKEAERELARLERLPSASPEYQVTRTYLEFVTELPWSKITEDKLDLARAREVLDEDHYNLKEVKERIIEHLAVLKLNPNAKAPILCFVGPPGVGKTSLGKSIARAIGREFARMSLGGLHDEAELRGHRRTYVGAMPGRIIQAIRRAGVRNPLLMLDEVDKLGRDFRGDPAAALIEILDPAQNFEFRDNYLDLPFDLSKVFFITTANALDTIPQPLLDRMEILRLAGYSDLEKRTIARQFLFPRQRDEAGLSEANVAVPDETVGRIIHGYTREAGVRELERMLATLCRKVATRFATGQTEPISVRPEDLADMLGSERFFEEAARKELPPGVAAGLAWTQAGGEILYVEAVRIPEGKDLTLTGQLGSVMKESAMAARSFITSKAEELGVDVAGMTGGVHIHVPAGATPKDGPSAGITMAVALAALYGRESARSDTAMTGEITLSGLVLPVGGIKEKILAAHRSGIRRVILPKQNQRDLRDLPEHVTAEMEFVFIERIDDGLVAAIPAFAAKVAPAAGRRVAAV